MHCNSVWGLCLRWAQAPFNFDTTCVEVACATSLQLAAKWFLTSAQVGQMLDFGLPTNLVGGRFFIPDKLSGSWFSKFCPTWAELFFWIFSWNASKNAFLVGYHWERFFLKSLTKTPLPPATTWRIVLKIAAEARIWRYERKSGMITHAASRKLIILFYWAAPLVNAF